MKITMIIVFVLLTLVFGTCLWCAIQIAGMISKSEDERDK